MYFIENINIVPKFTEIKSLEEIDLSAKISKNIDINMPIVFLNYNKKNDYLQAIDLSVNGSIGFIHHKCTIDEQVCMVNKVKNYLSYIIYEPYTIRSNVSIKNIKNIMTEKNIGCLLVSNTNNQLLGIITKRDINYSYLLGNFDTLNISDIMTPFEKIIYVNKIEISLNDALGIIVKNRIKKLPIVDENNVIKGLITLKNILIYKDINKKALLDKNYQLKCGASLDLEDDSMLNRCEKLIKANIDLILIDYHHAHSKIYQDKIKIIKSKFSNITENFPDIIVGSVFTHNAIKSFIDIGVDGFFIKIKKEDNFPINNLMECAMEAKKKNIPIIISPVNEANASNLFKYISIGFSSVMLDVSLESLNYNLDELCNSIKRCMYLINCDSVKKMHKIIQINKKSKDEKK